ncbi:hypothetical protein MGN70_006291 [Eutypa lata]|nr:hypothetical protein MGN70_006291 [Eutypa lata]
MPGHYHYGPVNADITATSVTASDTAAKMKDTLIQHQGEAHVSLECLWKSLDSGTISGFPTTFEADLTERIHNIHASRGRVANEEGKWDYPWPSYSRIFLRLQSPMRCAYGH